MKRTNIIIIIVVALVGGAGYFYYFGSGGAKSETLESTISPEAEQSAARVLSLLNQISSLRIDTKIFESPEFKTLRDYTVIIPPLPVGRSNPFAPLPGSQVAAPPATTRTTTTRTR